MKNAGNSSALDALAGKVDAAAAPLVDVPKCATFTEFLSNHARVRTNRGDYVNYSFAGRAPLKAIAELISKIVRNCMHAAT